MIFEHTYHIALKVQQFLIKNGMTPMPHPPIHRILLQVPFFLFPQMKKVLKGKCFAPVEGVRQKTAEALKGIKTYKFKDCFEQWEKSLDGCVASNGEYFEGD